MRPTTDPQDELFDVLDRDGNPTGTVRPRGEIHREGYWHRGLHLWVYTTDTAQQTFVIFQRRSMGKDTWPGALDVTVGGHFRAGETLEDTLREAEEEIGLRTSVDELVLLGKRFVEHHGDTYIDRELNEVFALRCDRPLHAYQQHPDEVDGLVTVELTAATALFTDRATSVTGLEVCRNGTERQITATMDEFAGGRNRYGPAALAGIRNLANGRVPEPFLIRE